MNVKTFHAVDMREALSKVKADLGPEAVIISTRQVKKGNGSFGMFARPVIEVTAAIDEESHYKEEPRERHQERKNDRKRGPMKRRTSEDKTENLDQIMTALSPLRDEIAELRELIGKSAEAHTVGRSELKKAARLSDDLETMNSMFHFMVEQSDLHKGISLEPNYLICYRRMMERGIESQYAMSLIKKVKENVPGGRELDLRTIIDEVIKIIGSSMFIGDPIKPYAAGPRIVSLVGPTGVGKTTTIAKIAADLALAGKKVGLITIDTYRIAAVEQLKIYAGILSLPIEVVMNRDELKQAISKFCTKDVIIIDTAGRSQRDTDRLDELSSFLEVDDAIENYLVMSAAAEQTAMDEIVKNFGIIPLAGLIFTKLDETIKPGTVITQNFKTGLPVVYTTHGQKVPEDIEEASAKKLALKLFKKEL